jgi:hypothetical protein
MTEPQRVFTRTFTATYPADVRHMVGDGVLYGPNTMGERFYATAADFDEAIGKTRVRFELARPTVQPVGAGS